LDTAVGTDLDFARSETGVVQEDGEVRH
jgi:hypothetical protein